MNKNKILQTTLLLIFILNTWTTLIQWNNIQMTNKQLSVQMEEIQNNEEIQRLLQQGRTTHKQQD